ncbi:hypothetical protein MWU75_12250 [Ornithinimicrobium sp. F0845]|uniref:hypothetical protein n=1 Tax=Ornithinimicrobium sp. F0845 TaxID=2926412 RepID=UPI001FF2A4C1|nr:hypothetical protein [Ornithinimicrobium sp. F0845]MCK0112911.1 hypothetical protein [Ornithinimicrobium sp. F0845]
MSPAEDALDAEDRLVRAAATQLYAGAPADFIATRTALVKSAKTEGEKGAATAIGALRRPSVAAWALNQLVHRGEPVIEELADLGARLRHATSALDAAGIAGMRGERDAVLAALVAAAARVAGEEGQKLTATVEAEVRDTGIAALADEAAEAVLRSGTLTRALSYSGFGEVDVSEAAATTSTGVVLTSIPGGRTGREAAAPEPDATESESSEPDATEPDRAESDSAESDSAESDSAESDTDAEGGDAQGEGDHVEAIAEAAAQEREREIAEAEKAVSVAEQEVGRRRASVEAARNRTEATRQRLQKLEQQLETARAEDDDALEKLTSAVSSAKRADAELKDARDRLDRTLAET